MRRSAWLLLPVMFVVLLAIGVVVIRFDNGWNQVPDCGEQIEQLVSVAAAGPIRAPFVGRRVAAIACGGIDYNARTYPNLLPLGALDLASLGVAGKARHTKAGDQDQWELASEYAYRVPGVADDRALIVVLSGTPRGPAIAWRSPFPASACGLLALRPSDARPKACI